MTSWSVTKVPFLQQGPCGGGKEETERKRDRYTDIRVCRACFPESITVLRTCWRLETVLWVVLVQPSCNDLCTVMISGSGKSGTEKNQNRVNRTVKCHTHHIPPFVHFWHGIISIFHLKVERNTHVTKQLLQGSLEMLVSLHTAGQVGVNNINLM